MARFTGSTLPSIRRYRRVALLMYMVGGAFSIGNLAYHNLDLRRCDGRGHTTDRYIHACPGASFAHYGHGGVFYGLEPGTHDAIRKADIVFLGTSRMMWGFSTDAKPIFPMITRIFSRNYHPVPA